jgi:hypothetical protein
MATNTGKGKCTMVDREGQPKGLSTRDRGKTRAFLMGNKSAQLRTDYPEDSQKQSKTDTKSAAACGALHHCAYLLSPVGCLMCFFLATSGLNVVHTGRVCPARCKDRSYKALGMNVQSENLITF